MILYPVVNMNCRERFIQSCHCEAVDRPPVWLMRQAGRALPEYRELRQRYSFLELVRTPELAAEATLQPIRRFGFDAAILFSDILVVPEALGQPYQFRDGGGIQMVHEVRSPEAIGRLQWQGFTERLQYVACALRLLKTELAGRHALIGFSGSPWTLANFMIEGGSAKPFTQALDWWQRDRAEVEHFLEQLAAAVTDYLAMQIEAGAEVVQIFDSLSGLLPEPLYEAASGRWIRQIVASLKGRVPVIVFCRGNHWRQHIHSGAQVLGLDWLAPLPEARHAVPAGIGIQGNLDPEVLLQAPELVAKEATRILTEMNGRPGFIFNLGHGLPPAASLENLEKLVATIKQFAWVS